MYLKYERAVMTRREFVGGAATFAAMGYNSNVAGVAVKIVGMKPGLSIYVR